MLSVSKPDVKKPRESYSDVLLNKVQYDITYLSDKGTRLRQEDTAYVDTHDSEVFAVLCDGMGGITGGDLASETAVSVFREFYETYRREDRGNGWMHLAAVEADKQVFHLRDADGNRIGAGSTLVAVHLTGNAMHWVSVGDSRIYILRENRIVRVTNDHILRNTKQFREQSVDGKRNLELPDADSESLVSYLGIGGLPLLDINEDAVMLRAGDTVMLCSDGLYKNLSDDRMAAIIQTCSTVQAAAEELEQALCGMNNPEQDNYTLVLIRIM